MLLNAQGKVINAVRPQASEIMADLTREVLARFAEEQRLADEIAGVRLYDANGHRLNTSKAHKVSGKPFRVPFHCTKSKSNSKE